ncbi:hypothetical protein PUN28_008289 [Cardiocondyla obscurior]|uniref:Uncharacterized protein n=1 Tax=Cardiocondyla obscurior TaxID=286306 RepID=A0AAW2FXE8_9HYME
MLLSYMIPPKGRVCFSKEHYKASISEYKNSMVAHVKTNGEISSLQDEKIKNAQRLNGTVQPYIIVVGPTLLDLNGFYVCIDKVLYQVSTALEAINICFKIFHVFNVQYPAETEHLWYVLQVCLFKFSTKYDKQISYVMPVINAFKFD